MKKILLAILLFSTGSIAFSQGTISKGGSQINLGAGFSDWGVPIYLGFDCGVAKDFTLGAEASYRSYRENWHYDYYRQSIIGFSGNGNYHFNSVLALPSAFDFYAGLNIGFYIWSSPDGYHGDHSSGLGIGGQVGGRYFFTNKLALNLEFGGGNAFSQGKIGLTFRR